MVQNAAILGFSIWLAGQVLGVSSGVLSFDGVQLAAPRPLPAGIEDRMVDDELRQRLVTLIEVDRIHLDPDLTFAMFVQRMNAPERDVRKLVNHELGFDHYTLLFYNYRVICTRREQAATQRP